MVSRSRFGFLKRRPENVAADVDAEIALHFEMRVDELRAQGLSLDVARRQARHEFGDIESTRQYCRRQDERKDTRMQRTLMFQDITQDFKICCRSLLRSPVLAATIVLTVGLGIGATAAIFSAVNAALLRPLPYRQPDRLEASIPGVFACGDVRLGSVKRLSAAVGEGSAAVQAVHTYLAAPVSIGAEVASVRQA